MTAIIITLLTFVLIMISLIMVIAILMQRGSSSGGMGAAFGGGVAESAFGAETTNVLVKATRWTGTAFFIVAFALYLLHIDYAAQLQAEQTDSLEGVTEGILPPPSAAAPALPVLPEPTATLEVPAADAEALPDETMPVPAEEPVDGLEPEPLTELPPVEPLPAE